MLTKTPLSTSGICTFKKIEHVVTSNVVISIIGFSSSVGAQIVYLRLCFILYQCVTL